MSVYKDNEEQTEKLLNSNGLSDDRNGKDLQEGYELPKNNAVLTSILLLNVMLGTGIFNQPFVFKESGYVGAIIAFLIGGITSFKYMHSHNHKVMFPVQ